MHLLLHLPKHLIESFARLSIWTLVATLSVFGVPNVSLGAESLDTNQVKQIVENVAATNPDEITSTDADDTKNTEGTVSEGSDEESSTEPSTTNNPSQEPTETEGEDVGGVADAETDTNILENKVRFDPYTGQSLDGSFKFNPLIPPSWWIWEPRVRPQETTEEPQEEDGATALTNQGSTPTDPSSPSTSETTTNPQRGSILSVSTASAATHPTMAEAVQSMSLYSPYSLPAMFADIKHNFRYSDNKLTKETTNTLNYLAGGLAFLGMTILASTQTHKVRLHRRRVVSLN